MGSTTLAAPSRTPGSVTARPAVVDPNLAEFPDSSLIDFSFLLDPPAGKHGFLLPGRDGHFYFQDGTRGRFWGINVAKTSVFQPQERIDEAIGAIARAGFNLVRLHHVDGLEGLLPPERAGTEERIDPEKLDALDYWIAQLKARGIYVYLDLLDYRTFQAAEGVENAGALGRGAKPCAVYNERLIELQLEYARQLLVEHVNPYTKLSYLRDPAVCLLEICDENGLFIREKYWDKIPPPYDAELVERWNFWLRERYGTTEALKQAWSTAKTDAPLIEGESLEAGTIRLPGVRWRAPSAGPPLPTIGRHRDPCAARENDVGLFCYSVHRQYFRRMVSALRDAGARVPISAVTDQDNLPDLRSVAAELDFVGNNFYYEHPMYSLGKEWRLPSFYRNRNQIADGGAESLLPFILRSRVHNKPLVVREWSPCWPNKYRSAGMVEMAAYGCLQDLDCLILFTYDMHPDRRRADYFDVRNDPSRWGLAGWCSAVFLQQLVRPAERHVAIGYSQVDGFFRLNGALHELYSLGWVSRVSGFHFDEVCEAPADLTVASGLSTAGRYPGGRCLLFSNWKAADLRGEQRFSGLDERSGYVVETLPGGDATFVFDGLLFDQGQKETLRAWPALSAAAVREQSWAPVGVDGAGERAYGLYDPARQNLAFKSLPAMHAVRGALDLMARIYGGEMSHQYVDRRRYVSDTGEVVRNQSAGVLTVDTPTLQIVAGHLAREEQTKTTRIELESQSHIGTLVLATLDGKAWPESTRHAIKMVSIAVNTGEQRHVHERQSQGVLYALSDAGKGPVRTAGEPSATPTAVRLRGVELCQAFLVNGTWEIVREGDSAFIFCDTPGARFSCPWLPGRVTLLPYSSQGPETGRSVTQPIEYPPDCLFVRLSPP